MGEEKKHTVDKETGMIIRRTDNGLKEGDVESPQTSGLLELDDNGLPAFIYDHMERVG